MNLKIILYLLITVFTVVFGKDGRLVGGSRVRIQHHPYQAGLILTHCNLLICGGAIITRRHVLTAAHCIYDREDTYPHMRVFVGGSTLDSSHGYLLEIMNFDMDSRYTDISTMAEAWLHDIAALTLRNQLVYNLYIRNIDLPDDEVRINIMAETTGWGKIHANADAPSNELRKLDVLIISTAECQRYFERVIDTTHLCGLNHAGNGGCYGDSGDPLVANGKIIGILSWVIPCAEGYPDIYTDVHDHLRFINRILRRPLNRPD